MVKVKERRQGERQRTGDLIGISKSNSFRKEVLPMDIIEGEILCRMPVKHLLRCKSVCKRWYSLIRNPNPKFINTHHQNQNPPSPLFLEQYISDSHPTAPIAFNPSVRKRRSAWPNPMVVNQNPSNLLLFPYYLGLPLYTMFLRPVNGMSLIVHPNSTMTRCRMAMFNPATRMLCRLPLGDFEFNTLSRPRDQKTAQNHVFGFGICRTRTRTGTNHITSVVDDHWVYKVIWLNLPPSNQPLGNQLPIPMDVAVAKVYTVGREGLGDKDWRIVDGALPKNFVNDYSTLPASNISMNGKCYWLSLNLAHILVFDMDEEVFKEIDTPATPIQGFAYGKTRCDVVLSEVPVYGDEERNSLALFVFERDFVDISILDAKESNWFQRRVHYVHWPFHDLFDQSPLLVERLQSPITDSVVLKAGRESFALYNPKTNRCVRFKGPSPEYLSEALASPSSEVEHYSYLYVFLFNFKESLFSIDGGIEASDRVLEDFRTF